MGLFRNPGPSAGKSLGGPEKTAVSRVRGNHHSPDRGRVKPWTGSCPPIVVEATPGLLGETYRVIEGVSRITAARRARATRISAQV